MIVERSPRNVNAKTLPSNAEEKFKDREQLRDIVRGTQSGMKIKGLIA